MREIRIAFFVVLFSFIALYAFAKILGPIPFAINSVTTMKTDLFMSTGTGEVSATAQTTHVSLGVTKTATTADAAKSDANEVINAVIRDLKALGIDEKDIKTTNVSVNPDYSVMPLAIGTAPAKPTASGFTATTNLEVETKDVETANKAIDVATKDGANVISGANFTLTDEQRSKLEDEARAKAIKEAKDKAKKIADAAGLKLGRLVNISESGGGSPVFYDARASFKEAAVSSEPTDLQPGENKVTVTVTLSYETL